MKTQDQPRELSPEDGQLVDVVAAALVDPNLHTDTRMRLRHEITQVLRRAQEHAYGPAEREAREQRLAAHGDRLPEVLESVLTDPNLHTDLRMRLHREIAELLEAAR
jgi:hypothetical protein